MYLKNLTMLGFKSFAEKTSLNFQQGITAIVGPNGCGKSNVADAIRWVLGEKSAKALRGGEMADVIFNGTDGRKPLGLAEVSLTLCDVDSEQLRAAGVDLEFNEVTLTRRVFRDGGSEYFINRTPCRLKDIQQLFMGTGVGRSSYSIMAQGNITQILSSKPEDRRMVFEEAAGITRYKAQKREALRKLESTEQNLLRLDDLIREVKRQIGSLQRQAGKARRYRQLSVELQHLDTQLARHEYDVLEEEIRRRQQDLDGVRMQMEEAARDAMRGEEEISRLREKHSAFEALIAQSQQRGLELKSESERHEGTIRFNEERMRELGEHSAQASREIQEAEERLRSCESERDALKHRITASTAALEQLKTRAGDRQQAVRTVEDSLNSRGELIREAQSRSFDQAQELARVRNEFQALELQRKGNNLRLEKLSAEKIQLEEERSRLQRRIGEFASGVELEKQDVSRQRLTLEERQRQWHTLQKDLEVAASNLDKLLQLQAENRSRLSLLEQLHSDREGYGEGTRAAARSSEHVLGLLADRIRVPDAYIPAIEAALGQNLQLVLIEQSESAERILADLRSALQGRASLAPLKLDRSCFAHEPSPPGRDVGEPAGVVVQAEGQVQELVNVLLGRTRIVRDLPEATSGWRRHPGEFDFVTLNGDVLNRHGVYTGGAGRGQGNGSTPSSILGRKNQIAECQAESERLKGCVAEASRAKGALLGEQTALLAGVQDAQTSLREKEVAVATREGEFLALDNSLRVLHQRIDTVVYEIQSLADQDKEGRRQADLLSERIRGLESEARGFQEAVEGHEAELDALRKARDAALASLTEAKVALASEEQLADSLARQEQPLQDRVLELNLLVQRRKEEVASFASRSSHAAAEIAASSQRMEVLRQLREQTGSETANLMAQRSSLDQDITGREDLIRGRRRQLDALQEQRASLEVDLAQKGMTRVNLCEQIRQRYQVELETVRSECITITVVDEGPAQVRTLTPAEMSAQGLSTDWGAVREQVTALQRKIEEMGPVNLIAIEEYEETEQRHQFLTQQNDDLVKARGQLQEVITRINSQTREMFLQAFEQIRENFRTMFTEVFGGGKADLMLVDQGDVLESGIDIVARPPGKQLQTISLLSGGEQTMTAVALLFAIYQVRPSPFCVLDELDAPLDESNINRFIRILQRFLAHSQFVIITHNKRTIGMADVLYGVTMEEHGVSKIVSVKFHKVDEPSSEQRSTPLVPPSPGPSVDEEEDQPHSREETLEMVLAK